MKPLCRRLGCAAVALLVAGIATADGVWFSEWQRATPLQSSSPSHLSPTAATDAEQGLFQRGFTD